MTKGSRYKQFFLLVVRPLSPPPPFELSGHIFVGFFSNFKIIIIIIEISILHTLMCLLIQGPGREISCIRISYFVYWIIFILDFHLYFKHLFLTIADFPSYVSIISWHCHHCSNKKKSFNISVIFTHIIFTLTFSTPFGRFSRVLRIFPSMCPSLSSLAVSV